MAIILRFARTLILLFAALVSSVSAIGKLMPVRAAPWFTYPDGTACIQPCLFGIRPGETPYPSAIDILGKHPFTRSFDAHLGLGPAVFNGVQMSVILARGSHDEVVRAVLVFKPEAGRFPLWAPLGQVLVQLGRPDLVSVGAETTRSFYENGQLMFMHTHQHPDEIGPQDELEGIFIDIRPSEGILVGTSWKGLGSARRYHVGIGGS